MFYVYVLVTSYILPFVNKAFVRLKFPPKNIKHEMEKER